MLFKEHKGMDLKNRVKIIVKDIGTGNNIKRVRLKLMKIKNKILK